MIFPKPFRTVALLLIVLSTISLAGCGQTTKALKISRDFTLGNAAWGMSKADLKKTLNGGWTLAEDDNTIRIDDAEVLGNAVTVIYSFDMPGDLIGSDRLRSISVVFPETADRSDLEAQLGTVLGAPETKGTMLSGEIYNLKEENYYWHSVGSVYDALNEEGKSTGLAELKESMKDIREVDEAYFRWWSSTRYLLTAGFEDTARFDGPCLVLSGEGSLTAEVLNGGNA